MQASHVMSMQPTTLLQQCTRDNFTEQNSRLNKQQQLALLKAKRPPPQQLRWP